MAAHPPQEEIRRLLDEAERDYRLKEGTLRAVYLQEARVVYMGRRRDVYRNLREIIADAAEESR
jgi:hypothetical protein